MEQCALPIDGSSVIVPLRVHLQPCESRDAHFRPQPEKPSGVNLLDTPEIQGIAHPQSRGVASATTKPDTTHEAVEPSSNCPGEREGVPPVVAADTFDHFPERFRGRIDRKLALIPIETAAGPVRIRGKRVTGSPGQRSDDHLVATCASLHPL